MDLIPTDQLSVRSYTVSQLVERQWDLSGILDREISIQLVDADGGPVGILLSSDGYALLSSLAELAQSRELYDRAFHPESNARATSGVAYNDIVFHHYDRFSGVNRENNTSLLSVTIEQLADMQLTIGSLLNKLISVRLMHGHGHVVGVLLSIGAFALLSGLAELAQSRELYLQAFSPELTDVMGSTVPYQDLFFQHG